MNDLVVVFAMKIARIEERQDIRKNINVAGGNWYIPCNMIYVLVCKISRVASKLEFFCSAAYHFTHVMTRHEM